MNKNQGEDVVMDAKVQESTQLQTYDIMMAKNILNHLGLSLNSEQLFDSLVNTDNKFFLILKLPMKSAMNALIMSQIDTYKIFCQKRLVDYIVLTNPDLDVQNSPDFTDKIPDSLIREKTQLLDVQARMRDVFQEHYNVLASIWSFLRKTIKNKEFESKNYNLENNEEFRANFDDFDASIEKIKLFLLDLRTDIESLSRSIIQVLSERNEFSSDPDEEQKEKSELYFYRSLGLDIE